MPAKEPTKHRPDHQSDLESHSVYEHPELLAAQVKTGDLRVSRLVPLGVFQDPMRNPVLLLRLSIVSHSP